MTTLVAGICELKNKKGVKHLGSYGDYDVWLRNHVALNIEAFETIEHKGKIVALMEWYEGRPVYENNVFKKLEADKSAIYVVSVIARSAKDIAEMGRRVLRLNKEAKKIYWDDPRYGGRHRVLSIKDTWRV